MNKRLMAIATMLLAAVMFVGMIPMALAEPYEVVMQWPSLGNTPSGLEDVEKAINEIIADYDMTIRLEPVNAFNLVNETGLAVSSGEKLDLCLSLFSGVGPLVNNGSILEITDLLNEYGQDLKKVLGERQITGGSYNGGMYGIPLHYVDGNGMGFVIRKDICDKYGITFEPNRIYTLDEMEAMFKTIKEGEGNSFYILGGAFSSSAMTGAAMSYDSLGQSEASGVLMLDGSQSTTVVNLFATDEFREFAERMYRWNQMGFFSSDAAIATDDFQVMVQAGNYLGSVLQVGFCQSEDEMINEDYTSTIGMEMYNILTQEPYASTSMYTSVLWSIASTSEKPEKAMQFMNLLYTNPDLCNLLMYGLEGVSYQIVEQDEHGTVIAPVDGMNTMTVPYWQNFGVYGDRLSWYVVSPSKTTKNERLRANSDAITKVSPALGYSFSIDHVSAKYSAVSAVVDQYLPIIQTGSIDPADELPLFLEALEKAGINDVIAENQKQLDEWLAAQN